jgi:hypothetical protein
MLKSLKQSKQNQLKLITMSNPNTNPLTLYIAVKQDATTQTSVQSLLDGFNGQGKLITDDDNLLHFVRFAGIPNAPGTTGNAGILLSTVFDGAMNPYLDFFYALPDIKALFAGIYDIATVPPASPNNLTNFENFINLNNLTQPDDLFYAYTATVAQIVAAFPPPPPPTTTTTEPLTLYVAVKQDPLSQIASKLLIKAVFTGKGHLIEDDESFLHYYRGVGIPNPTGNGIAGILIITEFVGAMNPYLTYFFGLTAIHLLFETLYLVAVDPPVQPYNETNFQNYINANNLNQPADLSFAYTATVAQIVTKFPPAG